MRILIVTQAVDKNHPVLGFFHAWLLEFAKKYETVTVITQSVGAHTLPANVTVHSLGKEKGASKPSQILRFWRLQWSLRSRTDAVFVHMTPIWVVLGWPVWKLSHAPLYLWYEARGGGKSLRFALRVVRKVFSATQRGLPLESSKRVIVGHGVDTERFAPSAEPRDPALIVTVGRITKIKRLDLVMDAFLALPPFHRLEVIGDTVTDEDLRTAVALESVVEEHGAEGRVIFHVLPHGEVPALLQRAWLLLHAAEGGLDKAVLEAMASGCPVVSCSEAAQEVLSSSCRATKENLGTVARQILELSAADRLALEKECRDRIVEHHGLARLIERLTREMQS